MLPELYRDVEIYVKIIQPKFAKAGENSLFVTIDGVGFRDSTIAKQLTSFMEK